MSTNPPNPSTLLPIAQNYIKDGKPMDKNIVVKMINKLSKTVKGHVVAAAGEFVGTFLFLLFGMGALNAVNDAPMTGENISHSLASDSSKLLFISLAFGFSLAVNAWVFSRVSGGLFNPAVTLGMWLIGSISVVRAVVVFVAQIVGAIAASAVVSGLTPGPLMVRTQLGDSTSVVQGVFIEMFLTAELVFTIFMLAAEKHAANSVAPVGIGLALFIAQLFGTYYTGCSVNPARSFGPDVVTGQFSGYHWIYWVGPALGAVVAAAFYKFIKALEYETVNMEAQSESEKAPCPEQAPSARAERSPAAVGRTASESSERTQVGEADKNEASTDLEAQKPARA